MKKRDFEGKRLHHFELSDKNRTVRWVLIIILLLIAAISLTVGITSALQTPSGWQTVTPSTSQLNCSADFVLQYEYGAGEKSATEESKALQVLYGKVVEDAWKLFFNEAGASDLTGLYAVNQHLNEELTIDSGLYRALEQVVESGSRALYLAPVYAEYNRVFYSESDGFALEFDPTQNEEQRAYVQTIAEFANDPESVQLLLIGDNKVKLQVSQEYLNFAKDHELNSLLDFGWLRNAFIADYIADALLKDGFTNGYLASADGFTRNLDQRGNTYSLNLFNMGSEGVDVAAVMDYAAPQSFVFLRSYSMSEFDVGRYYRFEDGRTLTSMIDPTDGQCKAALDNLVSYSEELGCGQLALAMMPVFVADSFSEAALNALAEQDIYSVWFSGKQLLYNQSDLKLKVNDPYYTK